MDRDYLSDVIGNIKDEYIEAAATVRNKKRAKKMIITIAAVMALAVTAVIAIPKLIPLHTAPFVPTEHTSKNGITVDSTANNNDFSHSESTEPNAYPGEYVKPDGAYNTFSLLSAEYPAAVGTAWEWKTNKEENYGFSRTDYRNYDYSFFYDTISTFTAADESKNRVFSPAGLFFTLSSLAEITGGESRAQILRLLKTNDMDSLRKYARSMWLDSFLNVEYTREVDNEHFFSGCIPANSFWLNKTAEIIGDPSTAAHLKNDYFTSLYAGDPNDAAFNQSYRAWLNDNTGGLLKETTDTERLSPETVFKLVNTLWLNAYWHTPFDPQNTCSDLFYGTNGVRDVPFMHADYSEYVLYYEGDGFNALGERTDAGVMWFILPDENVTLNDFINDAGYRELLDALKSPADFHSGGFVPKEEEYDMFSVKVSLPLFDISNDLELRSALQNFGVTDIFNVEKADIDFIRLKSGGNVFISDAKQAVRLMIDEFGISAAAATRVEGGMGAPVMKYVTFDANRPFMFLFLAGDRIPLFAGTINTFE